MIWTRALLYNNIKMEEDFFDWLEECPTQWFLLEDEEGHRSYKFIDNTEEEPDKE